MSVRPPDVLVNITVTEAGYFFWQEMWSVSITYCVMLLWTWCLPE